MLENSLILIGISLAMLLLGVSGAGLQREQLKPDVDNIAVTVVTSKEINKLLEKYPDAVKLVPTEKQTHSVNGIGQRETLHEFIYTLGDCISGDVLVAYSSDVYSWPQPHDISLIVDYPSSGIGAVVTCVKIVVYQTSNSGTAYVISGGIGYRNITFVIEAVDTYLFDYNSRIFGIY